MRPDPTPFLARLAILWPYALLALVFTADYLAHPALPGNTLAHPLGWWGWWDQGHYIKSAQALAARSLSPDAHWYPMGFSLLAAPFARFVPNHPFFFVDLICLLGALWCAIRIAGTLGINRQAAALLFLGSLLVDRLIFVQFVIPWNTTPLVLYVYGALVIALKEEPLRPADAALAAALAALVLVTRPGDMPAIAPIGLAVLVRIVREGVSLAGRARLLGAGLLAGALVLVAYAALHVAIFGLKASPYMAHSGNIGLSFSQFFAKLYAVVIDPLPLYGEGQGLARRAPWLVWALPALVLTAACNWRAALIAAVVVINIGFYTAYADFLPHGIWRYYNIHYLKLSYPLLAFLGCYGAMLCWRRPILLAPAAALALPFLVLRVQPVEHPVEAAIPDDRTLAFTCADCGNARVAVIRPAGLNYSQTYFEPHVGRIGETAFRNIYDFRTTPVDGTIRAVFPVPFDARPVSLTFAMPHGYGPDRKPQVTLVSTRLRLQWPRLP